MEMEQKADGFYDWFAGFIDGEGCFTIHRNGKNGRWAAARFDLKLRADDAEIIYAIQRRLGFGIVVMYHPKSDPRFGYSNPQVEFRLAKKTDCLKLVSILDEHPLRAKKLKDYLIWREAVLLLNTKQYGGYPPSKIHELKQGLEQVRKYVEVTK